MHIQFGPLHEPAQRERLINRMVKATREKAKFHRWSSQALSRQWRWAWEVSRQPPGSIARAATSWRDGAWQYTVQHLGGGPGTGHRAGRPIRWENHLLAFALYSFGDPGWLALAQRMSFHEWTRHEQAFVHFVEGRAGIRKQGDPAFTTQ